MIWRVAGDYYSPDVPTSSVSHFGGGDGADKCGEPDTVVDHFYFARGPPPPLTTIKVIAVLQDHVKSFMPG
jgi:hypothetical protein